MDVSEPAEALEAWEDVEPVEHAVAVDVLEVNRRAWDRAAPRFCGGTALPVYGLLAPTEAELRLLPEVRGARVLELGCGSGSGHSLAYLGDRGAADEDGRMVLSRSYSEEGPVRQDAFAGSGAPVFLHRRKLSTYLNALLDAGLVLQRLVEGDADPGRARPQDLDPQKWYSLPRAQLLPTTFVVRAAKPLAAP